MADCVLTVTGSTPASTTAQSDTGTLCRVLVKRAADAFRNQQEIGDQWRELNYLGEPDLGRAIAEQARFLELLASQGASLEFLPEAAGTGLDSLYVRDASVICDRGAIIANMGKEARQGEPLIHRHYYEATGVPIVGAIRAPGTLEGGDVVWLDARTVAVGHGYRTNAEGILQLASLVGEFVDELIEVPLPHWRGPADVFHLMSIFSPLGRDLALVYSRLMPVPFRRQLLERGLRLVEAPDEEFESLGCNCLTIAPGVCLLASGNPVTRRRLEGSGMEVLEFEGAELCFKGGGGPTCMTRPLGWTL